MGRQSLLAEASTTVEMKVFMLLALAAGQINSQEDGSGHGGMDGSGSGMEGSGYGMGGGYGMGSGYGTGMGYGGMGMGSGYGGMGMGMDMDNMIWPERCSRHCIYKKRDSYDDRMSCFARSQYSQS